MLLSWSLVVLLNDKLEERFLWTSWAFQDFSFFFFPATVHWDIFSTLSICTVLYLKDTIYKRKFKECLWCKQIFRCISSSWKVWGLLFAVLQKFFLVWCSSNARKHNWNLLSLTPQALQTTHMATGQTAARQLMTVFILCFHSVLIGSIALDNLIKTLMIWTEEFLDFSFFSSPASLWIFKLLPDLMRIRNFVLLYCIKTVSCDHLSVDIRDSWQRAITGRLMMRLQTLAALGIHSEHCKGMMTSLPGYPSISHWKC